VFIFIFLIIEHRKEKKVILISVLGILISVVYFILLFKVFIPAIETADKKFTLFNYGALGANPSEAVVFIVQHPVEAVKMFFVNHLHDPAYDGIKSEFYWVYLLSGGFIVFLRPKYLIWFIPIVAQKVLNDSFYRWGISIYYSIEIVTLLPISVFLILSEFKHKYLRYGLSALVCIVTLGVTIHKLDPKNTKYDYTMPPEKQQVYNKNFFKGKFDVRQVNKLLELIPPDARVSASDHMLPHISQRQLIYFFPTVKDAEYIVFSVLDDNWMLPHDVNVAERDKYLSSPYWEIVAKEYPVVLLRKMQSAIEISKWQNKVKAGTLSCDIENINKGKGHLLFSNNMKADTLTHISSEKFRSGGHSIKLTKENPYGLNCHFSNINLLTCIQASVWRSPNGITGNIVASCGTDFYQSSNTLIEKDSAGWEKLQLNFVVPNVVKTSDFSVYVWNSGPDPVYFDDLIIRKW
jgi:hypothetical protein